ncbi:MAG: hypothetical protein E3J22_05920 [Candidatus Aminicenantes bacterium]|nr:MAG: hypothetical protein E3J22_05920 [Candidatus Aminicenantes bacterium]
MIIVILRLSVPSEKRSDTVRAIRSIIGPTEAQLDCTLCRVYSQTENSDSLVLLEEWKSQEGLEQHIRSDDFRTILAVMDLAIEPPEIKFVTASNTAGMELIEELRG